MGAVGYVEQHTADLCYYLLESAAPRSAVQVLTEQTVQLAGGRITLAIIGSSHFLEIDTRGTAICELFACPSGDLAGLQCGHKTSDGASWKYGSLGPGLAYDFEMWRERLGRHQFEIESLRLQESKERRLHYSFPKAKETGSAVTCLEWQIDGAKAIVSTYHTFPGELAIVHTRSAIDLAKAVASQ